VCFRALTRIECPLCVCSYGHMIDNVVLIVSGTLHERDVHELLEKCHPLGMFDRWVGSVAGLYCILCWPHQLTSLCAGCVQE